MSTPLLATFDLLALAISVGKIVFLTFLVILPLVSIAVYFERRISAVIQDRVGPNRVGVPLTLLGFKKDWQPFGIGGLAQAAADGLKFILKEDFVPAHVRTFYYWLAPCMTVVPALLTCVVLPFGSELNLSFLGIAEPVKMVIADLSIGPLFTFAIASLGVYGIVLAGWASNSKYPFLGGVRASAQMISYEISLGLSIVPVLMIFGELNMTKMSAFQDANGWLLLPLWGEGLSVARWVLLIPVAISFVIFTVSMFAETNRLPFDLAECETELVAGYHTEYSSMKFALFFMGEYSNMIASSAMMVTLFLGGWTLPFMGLNTPPALGAPIWAGVINIGVFLAKVIVLMVIFIWVRWMLPRFRYDQLMDLGWRRFIPLALLNIVVTAVILFLQARS